ncbi:rhodanese-like domain-containing protein [Rehaibacterium terrae]|nr:rhodanese-like domain-containing protein [Rehaibacterium terrae]
MQPERDFVLLDVRSPELYARGHLPGAVNLPHGRSARRRWRRSRRRRCSSPTAPGRTATARPRRR